MTENPNISLVHLATLSVVLMAFIATLVIVANHKSLHSALKVIVELFKRLL